MRERREIRRMLFGLLSACLLGGVMGCGGTVPPAIPGLVPVSGTVTLDGKPLAKGIVAFVPADGGPSSTGEIVEGSYSLKYTRTAMGAKPGKYAVAVTSWITPPSMKDDGSAVAGKAAVPEKYMNPSTSELTAEIPEKGTEPINFDLKSGQ